MNSALTAIVLGWQELSTSDIKPTRSSVEHVQKTHQFRQHSRNNRNKFNFDISRSTTASRSAKCAWFVLSDCEVWSVESKVQPLVAVLCRLESWCAFFGVEMVVRIFLRSGDVVSIFQRSGEVQKPPEHNIVTGGSLWGVLAVFSRFFSPVFSLEFLCGSCLFLRGMFLPKSFLGILLFE